MKPAFLSKTVSTLGLITLLTTAVGTGVQSTAQAQVDISVPADIDDEACLASGFNSFYLLQNIDFSPEQLEKIFELSSLQSDAYEQLIASYPTVDDLSGGYAFVSRPGAEITPEVSRAMNAAAMEVTQGEVMREQIAALNEQFGQYGEFVIGKKVILTPERRAEMRQLRADFDAQYISVMTPQQQQQYQENLATKSRIKEACGIVEVDHTNYDIILTETTTF